MVIRFLEYLYALAALGWSVAGAIYGKPVHLMTIKYGWHVSSMFGVVITLACIWDIAWRFWRWFYAPRYIVVCVDDLLSPEGRKQVELTLHEARCNYLNAHNLWGSKGQ